MSEETPVEWRCLAGGSPGFGYSASTVVNRKHVVGETQATMTEALENLRLKAEAILRESGDQRRLKMIPPHQKRTT